MKRQASHYAIPNTNCLPSERLPKENDCKLEGDAKTCSLSDQSHRSNRTHNQMSDQQIRPLEADLAWSDLDEGVDSFLQGLLKISRSKASPKLDDPERVAAVGDELPAPRSYERASTSSIYRMSIEIN